RPDGKAIAAGAYGEVRLLSPDGKQELSRLSGHADAVRGLAWSKDGARLAAAGGIPGRQGEVKVWNSDGSLLSTITGHSDCIYGVALSPDGQTLATASYDKLIKLWDATTGKEIRTLKDHIDAIYALEFTPDGQRLVSGAADRSIKVWNPATGERLYTLSEPTDGVNSIAVSPDGRRLAAAGQDKTVRVWKLEDKSASLETAMIAHEDAMLKVNWSLDGKLLLTSSADRTLKLFRSSDLTELKMIPRQPDWAFGMEYSPDGARLALGRMDGSIEVLEVKP
ncbi:MAG: WD40 repeat domain-containing protein, partial [Acidobacteriota bacterium]